MASAQNVARFFIDIAQHQNEYDRGDLMTNLRLQKLLYFAQGWHLARFGIPLFDEPIEAWPLGPVVRGIYDQYKRSGGRGIIEKDAPPSDAFTPDEYALLLDVAREYDGCSTSALVSLSHVPNAPWSRVEQSAEIPRNEIHAYFAGKKPLPSFDDLLVDYPLEKL